jgi:hypothetical protein
MLTMLKFGLLILSITNLHVTATRTAGKKQLVKAAVNDVLGSGGQACQRRCVDNQRLAPSDCLESCVNKCNRQREIDHVSGRGVCVKRGCEQYCEMTSVSDKAGCVKDCETKHLSYHL